MKKISNYFELIDILNSYKKDNNIAYNNLPFNKRIFENAIDQDKVEYAINEHGLFLFVNENNYYNLFYLLKGDRFNNISLGKDILVNENHVLKDLSDDVTINTMLLNNGFELESINYQIEINLEKVSEKVAEEKAKNELFLQENGFVVIDANRDFPQEATFLWKKYLKLTDVPYDHYNDGNLIYLKKGDSVAAVGWYKNTGAISEWRHLVVDEEYRGKNLGSIMNYLWMERAMAGKAKKGIGWVEKNNKVSDAIHKKLGFYNNGKITIQYVKRV